MTDGEKLAYLAGLVDGEGTVSIRRVHNRAKSASGWKIYYAVEIRVFNTDRKMIDWISQNFRGSVWTTNRKDGKHKPCYIWMCSGIEENLNLMKSIVPFMITKRQLVECAIPLLEKQREGFGMRKRFFDEISAAGEIAMKEVLRLKLLGTHRGIRNPAEKEI